MSDTMDLDAAIEQLQRALDFYDQCKKDPSAGPTGAARDAREWLEEAARDVVKAHAVA